MADSNHTLGHYSKDVEMRRYTIVAGFFVLLLLPATSTAGKINFNSYWTVKMKTSQSVDIVSLETDYDTNGQLLFIYITTSCKESSFGSENLENTPCSALPNIYRSPNNDKG